MTVLPLCIKQCTHDAFDVQAALHTALQLVSNSPDYGLSDSPMRAQAVIKVYRDLRAIWALRSDYYPDESDPSDGQADFT